MFISLIWHSVLQYERINVIDLHHYFMLNNVAT